MCVVYVALPLLFAVQLDGQKTCFRSAYEEEKEYFVYEQAGFSTNLAGDDDIL